MGIVLHLTLAFIAISLFIKKFTEYVAFLKVSNLKYQFLDFMCKFCSFKMTPNFYIKSSNLTFCQL